MTPDAQRPPAPQPEGVQTTAVTAGQRECTTPPGLLDHLSPQLRARIIEVGNERVTAAALRAIRLDERLDGHVARVVWLLGYGSKWGGRPFVREDITDRELDLFEAILNLAELAVNQADNQ